MVKKLLALLVFINCSFTYAETIKTDVLVIGNGASAVAAAIQSGRSKVKTILLVKGGWLENMASQSMVTMDAREHNPSGIWEEFGKEIHTFYKATPGYDTLSNTLNFEPFTGAAILKKMADSVKGLTIKLNTPYTAIEKDGTGWEVTIVVNGKKSTIKAKVVIDATENAEVVSNVKATLPSDFNSWQNKSGSKLYRTAIATGTNVLLTKYPDTHYPAFPVYCIPLSAVVIKDADNLLITDKALFAATENDLPAKIGLGQGVGATAAFCAFFKTTAKNLNVRAIQIELLDFKGSLLYFNDVDRKDPYYRAIQQIAATGMLQGISKIDGAGVVFNFRPDSVVITTDIKPVLTELYSRAFLWLNRVKPGEKFTVGNLLSLISEITLTEPNDFRITMQKAWKTEYKLQSDFDLNRPVTRREFAILANQYLNPFARAVDLDGRTVN